MTDAADAIAVRAAASAAPGSKTRAGHGVEEVEQHFDYTATKMGMWLFLLTELLLFGGIFIVYAMYRHTYAGDFHEAAKELNLGMGLTNTMVLLTSSMFIAMSITALQKGQRKLSIYLILLTVLCALAFMVIKYFEWTTKFHHGLFPGSPFLVKHPHGQQMFFGLYFVMTGLHGLHVIIGAVVLAVAAWIISKRPLATTVLDSHPDEWREASVEVVGQDGDKLWSSEALGEGVEQVSVVVKYRPTAERMTPREYVLLENSGLYWHLVDIIWIFLFPLFYLIT